MIQKSFQADSLNALSTSEVFLLGWQLLVWYSRCFSFCLLHLLSATLIMIIYFYRVSYFIDLTLDVLQLFFGILVISGFLCTLVFVGFLLLSKDAFLMLSHCSLTAINSKRTLHLASDLVGMYLVAASK